MDGTVFDIQRYSLQNGPGIRTTVFMKGCMLRCQWCSNPESQNFYPEYMYDLRLCKCCGKCGGKASILAGKCCSSTEKVECINGAVKVSGYQINTQKVFDIVKSDVEYYCRSGGGITLSGGECLLQREFSFEILERCRDAHIHTCVDTCLHVPSDTVTESIKFTDLYLADLKHMDSRTHEMYTGYGNEQILRNLEMLMDKGCRIWVRIPVISGVNDANGNFYQVSRFLRNRMSVEKVELLPAHSLSQYKYEMLNRKFIKPVAPPVERMKELAHILETDGIHVNVREL